MSSLLDKPQTTPRDQRALAIRSHEYKLYACYSTVRYLHSTIEDGESYVNTKLLEGVPGPSEAEHKDTMVCHCMHGPAWRKVI